MGGTWSLPEQEGPEYLWDKRGTSLSEPVASLRKESLDSPGH